MFRSSKVYVLKKNVYNTETLQGCCFPRDGKCCNKPNHRLLSRRSAFWESEGLEETRQ